MSETAVHEDKDTKMRLKVGVGINDADYLVSSRKKTKCPFYVKWSSMLDRCYGGNKNIHNPTYKECTVCDEWLIFSNFKAWMETQDWEGKHLDKDLLFPGNKVYCPEGCCFLPEKINTFLKATRKDTKSSVGVYFEKSSGKFAASVSNPFTGKRIKIGRYKTEKMASDAWRAKKCEFAVKFSEEITEVRISEALKNYFKEYPA